MRLYDDGVKSEEAHWVLDNPWISLLAAVALLAGVAAPAAAQFSAAVSPGSLGQRSTSTKESVEAAMEAARWRLGPLRLAPWLALDDFSYVDNVFGSVDNKTSDVTTTVSTGLQGNIPIGPKLVLGLYAVPRYTWWADLTDLRDWNYSYGAGLFGYFNRLTLELKAGKAKQQQFQNPEFGPPAAETSRSFSAVTELVLLGRLSVFATGSRGERRFARPGSADIPGVSFGSLDRDEDLATAGLRYRWSPQLAVGVGIQASKVTFVSSEQDRSNSGKGAIVDMQLGFKSLSLTASYANMRLRPEGASEFQNFDGLVGRTQLGWRGGTGWEAGIYGGRSLSFGFAGLSSYSEDVRYGASMSVPLGWRARLGGYAETGTITYLGSAGVSADRKEDTSAIGADASITLGGWGLRVGVSRSKYGGFSALGNREVKRISASLSLPGAVASWW